MIRSMTAFATQQGSADAAANAASWTWEVRSVNGRGLDVKVRLPDGVAGLEAAVRSGTNDYVSRGNVTIGLRLHRAQSEGTLQIDPARLDEFRSFMVDHVSRQLGSTEVNIETSIDGALTVQGAQPALVKMLIEYVGPFGQEHPEPLFMLNNVRVISADVVGDSHIRAMVTDWEGGPRMKAMAFRALGTPLGDALLKQTKEPFHLAGHLKIDNWTGQEKVELHIRDGAFVTPAQLSESA